MRCVGLHDLIASQDALYLGHQYCSDKNQELSLLKAEEQGDRSRERDCKLSPLDKTYSNLLKQVKKT